MNAFELKKGIYWVGAIDWSLRNFHGYATPKGSTYNAYLIIDEKITLIDAVKSPFAEELLERISKIVDPAKIDYIISNHVEMDHSGAIPAVLKVAPNATVFTSASKGASGLTAHLGEHHYVPVKSGETISLGTRSLTFTSTPMLHWPDNMVAYCPEEKILFSNDAFGQHYASSGRLDCEEPFADIMFEAKQYYANILMPFSTQVKALYNAVSGFDIELIAPSHGIIWKDHIPEILECYVEWSSNEPKESAVVVFDSMWHSTEKMAKAITEAFADKGVSTKLFDLKETHISEIITHILTAKYIAVGSSTLNNNMLPTVAAFLSYLKGLAPKNRKAFAFGSYGWGGQSIGQVEEQLLACGFEIMTEKIRINYIPTQAQLAEIAETVHKCLEGEI